MTTWTNELTAHRDRSGAWVAEVRSVFGELIAHAYGASKDETETRARLIAQAPAMAEALRTFFDAYKDHPERLGTSSAAAAHLEHTRALLRAIDG